MSEEDNKKMEEFNIIPGYKGTFEDYAKESFNIIKMGIKAGNSLPSGDNFKYYSCFSSFNGFRYNHMEKLSKLMEKIVVASDVAGSMKDRDMDEKFDLLIETNDVLLDRANACMDEEAGISKKNKVELIVAETNKQNKTNYGSWNEFKKSELVKSTTDTSDNNSNIRLLAGKNIQRPQLSFKDKIDNTSSPWKPRIKEKPNGLKPLEIYLIDGTNDNSNENDNRQLYCHPYKFELDVFTPNEWQLEKKQPIKYKSLEDTALIYIDKLCDLKIMLEDLNKYDEISVDLEHHSYRTFQGITCLMQISSRDTDYIIDTLVLRSELYILNEIFTKPTILKVFHGAESDILWLQRDLSLYIVNMFDTYQAAKQLNLPYLSLSYLLKTYCNVDPNKHFQLADWRIRPLPNELIKYAREDTHYLLYVKDILTNSLIDIANGQTNILNAVYNRSSEVCKLVYEKPIFTENNYMNLYRKSQKMFNNRQLFALKELYFWRDSIARIEDDSVVYVLPNHMLLNIAETLPREMQGILACCNPIPPLVRQNLLKLHKLILKAREQPLIKPIIEQDIRQRLTQRNQTVNTSDISVWSPHDITPGTEIQSNLPCLLDNSTDKRSNPHSIDIETKHSITIFDSPPNSDVDDGNADDDTTLNKLESVRKLFISPFERYKRVIPMIAAQEEKERTEKNNKDNSIKESIERVHEHFLQITDQLNAKCESSASSSSSLPSKKKKRKNIPLSQVPGTKKRKNNCSYLASDNAEINNGVDTTTPKPENNTTVARIFKNKAGKKDEEKDVDKKSKSENTSLSFSSNTQKKQKRENFKELEKNGMLPKKDFDYKEVDFSSSFQGGSKSTISKVCPLQQKLPKQKRKKQRGKKKQKLGI